MKIALTRCLQGCTLLFTGAKARKNVKAMYACPEGHAPRTQSPGLPPLVVLLVCLSVTGCFKGPAKGTWAAATGAEELERLMWQSIRDKQWNEVENHLAPMFVGVDTHGKQYDRAAWLDHWKSVQVRNYSLGEITVQPNGADMVVSYEVHVGGEMSGQAIPDVGVRVVSVWQQLKKGWVMISQSGTPVR